MGEVVDMGNKVIVGRVRGKTYSAARLRLWTMEIWGNLLKELLTINTFTRGCIALSFHREEYTKCILSHF